MNSIDIYRAGAFLVTIKPDDSSTLNKKAMGENELRITFKSSSFIAFEINDECTAFGEIYKLNELPVIRKESAMYIEYTITMQSEAADLSKVQFLFPDAQNNYTETDFSVMGDAATVMGLLLINIARVYTGWALGEVVPTGFKNITFSKENCYNALSRIAAEFGTEFWVDGKTVHLAKRQIDTGYLFKVGKLKGLYELTRSNVNSSNIITRLYASGSDKNLPSGYPGTRLRMCPGQNECTVSMVTCTVTLQLDGTNDFVFDFVKPSSPTVGSLQIEYRPTGSTGAWSISVGSIDPPRTLNLPFADYMFRFKSLGSGACSNVTTDAIQVNATFTEPLLPAATLPYIEKNTTVYGIIEASQIYDDFYPGRTGTVTAVLSGNIYKFKDIGIDFNINTQLLPGIAPKVVFQTGQLAGYQFDVSGFDNSTKEITILLNKDEKALEIPNTNIKPAIGDKYILIDIKMPQRYVTQAETALYNKAVSVLDQAAVPQTEYRATFDPVHIKRQNIQLRLGQMVYIEDTQLGIGRKIRIVGLTRNIVNEYEYQVDIADTVTPGTISRILNAQLDNERGITGLQNQIVNNSILNNNVIGTLIIKQGTIQIENIPASSGTSGMKVLYLDPATGKIYVAV